MNDVALALLSSTFSSSLGRTEIHSPFSFLPPSPATIHGSKWGGVVTSFVDNSTTPGSKQPLKDKYSRVFSNALRKDGVILAMAKQFVGLEFVLENIVVI